MTQGESEPDEPGKISWQTSSPAEHTLQGADNYEPLPTVNFVMFGLWPLCRCSRDCASAAGTNNDASAMARKLPPARSDFAAYQCHPDSSDPYRLCCHDTQIAIYIEGE